MTGKTSWAMWSCVAVLIGCGGSPTTPTPRYPNIAGTYTGEIYGTLPGAEIDGILTLTLQQSDAVLSGGYTFAGTVNGGSPGHGSVTLTGTVTAGSNPTVSFTVRSEHCPSTPPSDWAGIYLNSRTVEITGVIHFLDSSCVTQTSWPTRVPMNR